ncbi:MAG: hypothetical protein HFG20_10595 [Anaerotruncus sp.]|nr:hypothetical protein [Anaerotruncus sp.]
MFGKLSVMIGMAALILGLMNLSALAAAQPPGTLLIERTGKTIAGSDVYASSVLLELVPEKPDDRVLIKEDGIWMLLTPDENQKYLLTFQNNKDYQLAFCTENADGIRSTPKLEQFTIDSQLARTVEACIALPSLLTAKDAEVESRRSEIMEVQAQFNDLTEKQRASFPANQQDRLQRLVRWLNNMKPRVDVLAPETPLVRFLTRKAPDLDVYPLNTQVEVQLMTTYDIDKICVRYSGGNWIPLEKNADNRYLIPCNEAGSYVFDVCTQDAAGNRSPTRSLSFLVAPEFYQFLTDAANPTAAQAEKLLIEYQQMNLYYRRQVPQSVLDRLSSIYRSSCAQTYLFWETEVEGQEVRALGMLAAFPSGRARLVVNGSPSAQAIPVINRPARYAYTVSFSSSINEEQLTPAQPVLLRLGIPAALRHQNDVRVYDSTGKEIAARIKSEDRGLILEFFVAQAGTYYVAATPATSAPTSSSEAASSSAPAASSEAASSSAPAASSEAASSSAPAASSEAASSSAPAVSSEAASSSAPAASSEAASSSAPAASSEAASSSAPAASDPR